ncbi:hypothetical protein M758_4G183300 [Ceratodon purpureus]|nr:hypothetical protein M758_4G183300 [Ceratodon purpureus]
MDNVPVTGHEILEAKRISHYSNQQLILLVGEGDFSFASSLATAFGSATNIVATSLDSKGDLLIKYGTNAELNTSNLARRGALVLHSFDACYMSLQHQFRFTGFHRIVFNFPHAGYLWRGEHHPTMMAKHKELVRLFFANAKEMLLPEGQVHVSHKLGHPYDGWLLEEQAESGGLTLLKRVPFHQEQFPGYRNRRGQGSKAGSTFKLGKADTYIFTASNTEQCASKLKDEALSKMLSLDKLVQVKALKERAIRKLRASEVTPLHRVVADEVARLENLILKLGTKKLRTLETLRSVVQLMNKSGRLRKELQK